MIYTTSGKVIDVSHKDNKVIIEITKPSRLVFIMFELDEENKQELIKELQK